MKTPSPIAVCLGVLVGFLGCSLIGRISAQKNLYQKFFRLHRYLEQETSYYPTTSQLVAVAHSQCPPSSSQTLVIIGGNSVFNGSGQKGEELWSRVLQGELGDQYHVVNFSAPGAGVVDNGGVIFEILAREYPRALFVTNTEPGRYPAAYHSAYAYLYWDAYYKGLLPEDARRPVEVPDPHETVGERELRLGRRLNGLFYFNDLWTRVSYRYTSTIWTSWLKGRSFYPRRKLGDWYDKRKRLVVDEGTFQQMLPIHLEALRHRPPVLEDRFQQASDGTWVQTEKSLHEEKTEIAALLPEPLHPRSLIVLTPYNPFFLAHLTDAEQSRVQTSFRNGADLLGQAGYHALSLIDQGFQPMDFGDTVHLSPSGGRRLAHFVADAIREMNPSTSAAPVP